MINSGNPGVGAALPGTGTGMRAIRLHEPGGPVSLEEIADPVPGPGEVLLEVHAAALTAGELRWPRHWPATISHEAAGIVTALGPDAAGDGTGGLAEGQAVFGLVNFDLDGAAADYVVVPARDLAVKPGSLGYPEAASLTLAPLTAWQALVDHGHLRGGQHVLVNGAAGGVGSYAVQLAKALGARVTGIAAARDADFLRDLGADTVIDYAEPELQEIDADLAIDLVGGTSADRLWSALRPGGTLIGIAAEPEQAEARKHQVTAEFFIVEPNAGQLAELARLAESGTLRTVVSRVFPLDDAVIAVETLEHRHSRGKIVLSVRPNAWSEPRQTEEPWSR
jgi:NADPH:quinone reductase-like Zn-dependent oxidoreductase